MKWKILFCLSYLKKKFSLVNIYRYIVSIWCWKYDDCYYCVCVSFRNFFLDLKSSLSNRYENKMNEKMGCFFFSSPLRFFVVLNFERAVEFDLMMIFNFNFNFRMTDSHFWFLFILYIVVVYVVVDSQNSQTLLLFFCCYYRFVLKKNENTYF